MSTSKVKVNDLQPSDMRTCPFCGVIGLCWLVPCCQTAPIVNKSIQSSKEAENIGEKVYCSNLPSNRNLCSVVDKIQPKLTPTFWNQKRLKTGLTDNGNELGLVEGSITNTNVFWLIDANKSITRFFYENGIDSEFAKTRSFSEMILDKFGPNFPIPTSDELRGWIIEHDAEETSKYLHEVRYLNEVRRSWAETGSSILIDGWANAEGRNFISIFLDSPKGTIYLRSYNVSDIHTDLEAMTLLFEQVIEEVGINNVVQIVTYSTSAFMKEIGEKLMKKYRSMYWTVDTSCCIALMVDKYGAIVSETLEKAKIITRFVNSHPQVQKFIDGELLARSKTGLERSFLTLENMVSNEEVLKNIFLSQGSSSAVVASTLESKRVANLVGNKSFWANARTVITAVIPLVRVMEWMNKHKSHMGYMYETMDQIKETIKSGFGNKESRYMQFWKVIDAIWDDHLYSPLHVAGYFLNPNIFYSEDICIDSEVLVGVCQTITRMAEDIHCACVTADQLGLYQGAVGNFAIASNERSNISPVEWWYKYGGQCPELQKLAIRILSQTCNGASRFQLNRDLVENLFKGRRIPIEQDKLCKMVSMQYNMQLSKLASGRNDCMVSNENVVGDWTKENACG